MHAPHHVPREWADKYKGQFDDGWDAYREKVFERQLALGLLPPGTKLSARDPDVAAWDSLGADEKRLYARMMEVFAGFLEHTDHHIGRLLDVPREDAGSSTTRSSWWSATTAPAPRAGRTARSTRTCSSTTSPRRWRTNLKAIDELGGPKYFNHYPWGWAWAGNTPFRRWKRETYRGGASDPFIVHWPKRHQGQGRDPQPVRAPHRHGADGAGRARPRGRRAQIRGVTQSPIQGVSFAHAFDDAKAETRHHTQYFEMMGHRAIYHDGWRAVCPVPGPSFAEAGMGFGEMVITEEKLRELDAKGWELYHVAEDFSETRNLAAEHRDKLIEMIALWYVEAGKYNVLPIDAAARRAWPRSGRSSRRRATSTSTTRARRWSRTRSRRACSTGRTASPRRSSIANGAEGVLVAQGGSSGGYALYVKDHKLHYAYNFLGVQQFHVATDATVGDGRHELRFEFEPTGKPDLAHGKGTPARAQLYVDGKLAGQGDLPITIPLDIGITDGLTCGRDDGSTVTTDYQAPFAFTGELEKVVVDVSGELIEDKARRDARRDGAPVAAPGSASCGEGGIRTLDTAFGPYNGLANRRLRPLGHLSKIRADDSRPGRPPQGRAGSAAGEPGEQSRRPAPARPGQHRRGQRRDRPRRRPAGRAAAMPCALPRPPRFPESGRGAPTPCARCGCGRAGGARARSRRRPACGPSRPGPASVRTGRPRRTRCSSCFASGFRPRSCHA